MTMAAQSRRDFGTKTNQMLRINKKLFVAAVIESGMTVKEVCVAAESSHQTYKKLKNGQMIKFPSLRRFCQVLDLKPAEILQDDDDETVQAQRPAELVHPAQRETDLPQHGRKAYAQQLLEEYQAKSLGIYRVPNRRVSAFVEPYLDYCVKHNKATTIDDKKRTLENFKKIGW